MGIIYKCDICRNEMNIQKELTGTLKYLDRNWMDAIKKGTEKSIVELTVIMCQSCMDKMKKYLNEAMKMAISGQEEK